MLVDELKLAGKSGGRAHPAAGVTPPRGLASKSAEGGGFGMVLLSQFAARYLVVGAGIATGSLGW